MSSRLTNVKRIVTARKIERRRAIKQQSKDDEQTNKRKKGH
jgi:hypothetical protein